MSEPDALFARLQLRPDATAQDLRRAYARELKKIDQAAQPEAFQELREAYERLGWWLRRKEQQAEAPQETAAPVVDATPEPEPAPRPEMLGAEVLQIVTQRLQQLPPIVANEEAEQLLARCLRDERLASLDARQYFEWGVASILAGGWQPGHERLFMPAVEAFGWRDERARLLWLGQPGQLLDQAIEELAAFDTQEFAVRGTQSAVIRALRDDARPATADLLAWTPVGAQLARSFPAWLYVISRPRQLEAWRRWDAEVPKWKRWLSGRRRRARQPVNTRMLKRASWGFGAVWFIAVAVGVLARLLSPSTATPPSRPSSVPAVRAVTVPPDLAPPALRTPAGLDLPSGPMKLGHP